MSDEAMLLWLSMREALLGTDGVRIRTRAFGYGAVTLMLTDGRSDMRMHVSLQALREGGQFRGRWYRTGEEYARAFCRGAADAWRR